MQSDTDYDYGRPAFWRLPKTKEDRFYIRKKKVRFDDEVQCGSPAYGSLLRGDIISKIKEYDARDLRHEDAQMLFRTAGNEIKLVVHRDNKIALTQGLSNESSRCSSTIPPVSPVNCLNPDQPHRAPSPFLPGPGHYETAMAAPVDTLPHTVFPKLNESGGYVPPARPDSSASSRFSPMPTRDHQQEVQEETAAIVKQKKFTKSVAFGKLLKIHLTLERKRTSGIFQKRGGEISK
ncbi:unnamed protein product [Hermetia illucens]|uniref:PDZ domain-containing protein n=1 Tax=Hermetia illucens TaxID=343691 RepID=A0A7R8UNH5_HERIL|nr:unnamed protein product [Hermetia illucens]